MLIRKLLVPFLLLFLMVVFYSFYTSNHVVVSNSLDESSDIVTEEDIEASLGHKVRQDLIQKAKFGVNQKFKKQSDKNLENQAAVSKRIKNEIVALLEGVFPENSSLFKYLDKDIAKSGYLLDILSPPDGDIYSLFFENEADIEEMFKVSSHLSIALRKCLAEDLCGQEQARKDNFFEKNNTPVHEFLNQALTVVKLAIDKMDTNIRDLRPDRFIDLLTFKNRETQTLTMQILMNTDDEKVQMKIYSKATNFTGQVMANYISLFSNSTNMANDKLRRKRDELVEKVLGSGDKETLSRVVAQIGLMNLERDSAIAFLETYCAKTKRNSRSEQSKIINIKMESFARRNDLDFRDSCSDHKLD